MPVAKTYNNYVISGEPFKENGRMYVNVMAPKGLKKVRWYTETEYQRMYPNEAAEQDIMDFNAREAFGFGTEGYITLYKGMNVEEWAEDDRRNIYFNLTFGYYTPGRLELPVLMEGIIPIQLKWEEVAATGDRMRPHEEVQKIVSALLNDTTNASNYQGSINDWIQTQVQVKSKQTKDSRYGDKHIYTLVDKDNNVYMWETGAKDYALSQNIILKMKVKEHKNINSVKTTVVWYCKEI